MAISPRDSDELRLALANTQDGSDPSYQGADTITVNVAASEPRSIGRHTILRRLGQGGMGVVYAAYDQELDRKVAVKLLHTGAGDTLGRQRLVREAQALARLSHPNVVTIYQVAESEGRVYIAMEFVDGTNLAAWQTEDRPWEDVLRMYLQAGRGLHAAHEAGLVHRDASPNPTPGLQGTHTGRHLRRARATGARRRWEGLWRRRTDRAYGGAVTWIFRRVG